MQDKVMPKGKWEFDENVTEVFDDMLSRSIPIYDDMRKLVTNIGKHYVKKGTSIVDIGCSNGNAVFPFVEKYGAHNNYLLIDVSEPMLKKSRERYKSWIDNGLMQVLNHDLREGLPPCVASLVLSVLTLQFSPIEYRQKIVKSVYDSLIDGGAFIFVEKVLGNTYEIDDVLVDEYYRMKKENAYTSEQIQTKRKSLEGVLVPITSNWNVEMLKETGFRQVDCFWRYLNFAGWIAVK